MTELPYIIGKPFSNGLTPDWPAQANSPYMESMQNLRPWTGCARTVETIKDPTGSTATWPFPQLLRGERETLLADATAISSVSEAWVVTPLTVYRPDAQTTEAAIISGGVWHHASFQGVYVLTNGRSFVASLPSAEAGHILCSNLIPVASVCAHKSRLFLAGLRSNWFSGYQWSLVMDAWRATLPQDAFSYRDMPFDAGWVVWGERGGGSSEVPFHVLLAALGYFGEDSFENLFEVITDYIERGEIGMVPVPTPGTIRRVMGYQDGVRVYGANGIAELGPSGNRFAVVDVDGMGIPGRGCVSGTAKRHVWVRTDGQLDWVPRQSQNGQSYRHWFLPMIEPNRPFQNVPVTGYDLPNGGINPGGFCVNRDGVFTVSNANNYVYLLTPDGASQEFQGAHQHPPGSESAHIAASNHRVFLADTEGGTVIAYANGEKQAEWGAVPITDPVTTPGDGQFDTPGGIVWLDNELYVCDSRMFRIQVFDENGIYGRKWSLDAYMPIDIIEHDGDLLVLASYSATRSVIRFTSMGIEVSRFEITGNKTSADGICVAKGEIYVTHVQDNQVSVWTPEGNPVRTLSVLSPQGIAYSKGYLYVGSVATQEHPISVCVFDVSYATPESGSDLGHEVFSETFCPFGIDDGDVWEPRCADFYNGELYVTDTGNSRVNVYDSNGAFQRSWASGTNPTGIAVSDGEVFVSDFAWGVIRVYDTTGTLLRTIGVSGSGDGELNSPRDIVVAAGFLAVTDAGNYRVQIFTVAGVYISQFGTMGTGDGEFSLPFGIDVTADRILVSDFQLHRIQSFTLAGVFVAAFGTYGSRGGELNQPAAIAVAGDDLLVTDSANGRVSVFEHATGHYLRSFGVQGTGGGELNNPRGIANDGYTRYVVEMWNSRVSVFEYTEGEDLPDTEGLTDLLMSYDPGEEEYWICNEETGYMFNDRGLGGPVDCLPTGLVRDSEKGLVGAFSGIAPSEFSAKTVATDMGTRAGKHVAAIQVSSEGVWDLTATISVRYDSEDEFSDLEDFPCGPTGAAFPGLSFADGAFGFGGHYDADIGASLGPVEVRYHREDKRFVRGLSRPPEEMV